MRLNRWLAITVVAASLVAAAACGDDDSGDTGTSTASGGEADLASMPAAREMTVEMRDLAFDPMQMTVPAGEVVEMAFHNRGALLHDFTIDEMEADVVEIMGGSGADVEQHMGSGEHAPMAAMHMALDAGQEGRMRMRIHEPGEYTFYCTVAGHREAGMMGTLTVQ